MRLETPAGGKPPASCWLWLAREASDLNRRDRFRSSRFQEMEGNRRISAAGTAQGGEQGAKRRRVSGAGIGYPTCFPSARRFSAS